MYLGRTPEPAADIVVIMLVIDASIVTRYFMKSSIAGVTDVTAIFAIWITFLGAAWLLIPS